jgi:hypothetical protein
MMSAETKIKVRNIFLYDYENYYETNELIDFISSLDVSSKRSTNSSTSKSKTQDCSICIETYRLSQFEKITSNCSHSNDICKKCVTRHIETQLNTKGDVNGILCPYGNDCGFLIEYNDVQRIVKGNLFER